MNRQKHIKALGLVFSDKKIVFYIFPIVSLRKNWKIVSEYDQEIPQSQTADNLVAPRGRAV